MTCKVLQSESGNGCASAVGARDFGFKTGGFARSHSMLSSSSPARIDLEYFTDQLFWRLVFMPWFDPIIPYDPPWPPKLQVSGLTK
ncbi:MAG: hypothetical protein IT423_01630 [Pirellulaceae bacterium]|nr:hypothetical protein [Pirellulaceae bacterium]